MGDISVIIPVYNEEEAIGPGLESLGNQSLRPKEVIVVDDGSTDQTWSVLSEFRIPTCLPARQDSEFRIIKQKHQGAGAARNFGAAKSTGKILVFVDADMRFSQGFLEDLTEPIRKKRSKGTFSKREFISNWGNPWARYWNWWRGIYEPRAVPKDYPKTAPVFRAILTTEFEKAGGFDASRGYDDDWSLSEKLGYRADETKARFYHRNPSSLNEAFVQARWSARRRYKHGMVGAAAALVRSCPLWLFGLGVFQAWRRRDKLAEPLVPFIFLYPLFLFVMGLAVATGVVEYLLFKKVAK